MFGGCVVVPPQLYGPRIRQKKEKRIRVPDRITFLAESRDAWFPKILLHFKQLDGINAVETFAHFSTNESVVPNISKFH